MLVGALSTLVLGIAAGIAVPAGLGWDFANFYDTGRRALAGQIADLYDPTTLIGGEAPQGQMTFWGAPISAFFYAPFGLLGAPAALVAFKVVATLAYLAGLVLLLQELRASRPERGLTQHDLALLSVLILLFQPFWTMYRVGGQTTPWVFLLLVLGLRAHLAGRPWMVGMCLAAAATVKPAFVLVAVLLGLTAGIRTLVGIIGSFAAVGTASVALLGWPIHERFLGMLVAGATKPSPWFFNSSIYLLADVVRPIADSAPVPGAGGWLPDVLAVVLKLAVLAAFAFLSWEGRRAGLSGPGDRRYKYLLALAFALLLSQVVWEHYLAILFVPLAFAVYWRSELSPFARTWLYAIFGLTLGQNLVLVMLFRDFVVIESHALLLFVTLFKAGPLLLYLGWVIHFRAEWLASSAAPSSLPPDQGR